MTLVFFAVLFLALAAMSASHAVLEGPASAYPGSFVRLLFLLASVVVFLALIRFRPQWELARDSMPFVFCGNVYASLHDLIRFFRAPDITATLAAWDHALFGVQPTVWAERFITPPATDFFTVCYWLFYVCGPVLGLLLWLKRDRRAFRYTMVTVVLCLYIGYVGYVAFPASAPRLFMPGSYTIALHGNTILDYTRSATAAVPLTAKGAFPSLHCGVALLTLLLAWKHLRWFFWAQLPFGAGLVLGTVYLRHHWVVDILAGFLVAVAAFLAGPRIEDRWHRSSRAVPGPPASDSVEEAAPTSVERRSAVG
jgi:membrane-associated phospholipid phosphatase